MPEPKKNLAPGWGILTIVVTLACWTSIPLFLKHFTASIDGWTANGWRYSLSALIWLPVLLWAVSRKSLPAGLWKAAIIPSIFNALGQAAFGLAPYYISPGLMTFSLRLQIVFLTVGAAIMFVSERKVIRSPLFATGLVMVIGGTLATVAFNPSGLGTGTAMGVGLSIGSGLLYACYSLAVRKQISGMNPLIAFSVVSQYTAIIMLAGMVAFARSKVTGELDFGMSVFHLAPREQLILAVSAVIGIGIGHTLYFFSISRLGLAVSAGVVQLQPVTVSLASMVIFHEQLSGLQWSTGIAAVIGAALMLYAQHIAAKKAKLAAIDEFDSLPVDEDVAYVASSNENPTPRG